MPPNLCPVTNSNQNAMSTKTTSAHYRAAHPLFDNGGKTGLGRRAGEKFSDEDAKKVEKALRYALSIANDLSLRTRSLVGDHSDRLADLAMRIEKEVVHFQALRTNA